MAGLLVLALGYFGGIAVNLLSYTELRSVPRVDRPEAFADPVYDVWFFGVPLIGAVLAYAYQIRGVEITANLAINIGASGSLILKSFAAAIPQLKKKTN